MADLSCFYNHSLLSFKIPVSLFVGRTRFDCFATLRLNTWSAQYFPYPRHVGANLLLERIETIKFQFFSDFLPEYYRDSLAIEVLIKIQYMGFQQVTVGR